MEESDPADQSFSLLLFVATHEFLVIGAFHCQEKASEAVMANLSSAKVK